MWRAILALVLFALAGRAEAERIACGAVYEVRRGDTLSRIAQRAYGAGVSYQIIYSANSAAIGADPGLIVVGQRLAIPCLDAAAPAVKAAPSAEPRREAKTAGFVRVVTGGDWPPFLDKAAPAGGMLTEIVAGSLSAALGPEGFRIDFINDWEAHLDPLLARGVYDLSSAWFRPDCAVAERLAPEWRRRCETLAWSDPIFEQVIGYYMTPELSERVTGHDDLRGLTLCRPAGYASFILEARGLTPPDVALERPSDPAACIAGLASGDYDVAVLAVELAEEAVAARGLAGRVVAREDLAGVVTLHVVAAAESPEGRARLAAFNDGLRRLRDNGGWIAIVGRHLSAHRLRAGG